MKKKQKKYSTDLEFEALHERAMITAKYMKSRQDIPLESLPF